MIAFSTCWNSQRHTDGYQMIEEIVELGFHTIEISHGLKISLLPGIIKAYQEKLISVCGVHNYCPSPIEVMMDEGLIGGAKIQIGDNMIDASIRSQINELGRILTN